MYIHSVQQQTMRLIQLREQRDPREQKHKEKTNIEISTKIISRVWDHQETSMYFPTVENNFQPSQKFDQLKK